jgi:hypothetical protein
MKRPERKSSPAETSETLSQFAAENPRCWLCGVRAVNTWPPRIQLHHICRGPDREAAREDRAALLAACPMCHAQLLDAMPVARQLGLKKMFDSAGYDRRQVNIIRSAHNLRGPQPEAITEAEVDAEVAVLERMIKKTGTGWPFPKWSWN